MNQPSTDQNSTVVTSAVRKILKPLVSFLLDNGMTYQWLVKELKSIYVEVADEEFSLDSKEQTDSRVSFITGVHRKDVKRLRHETGPEEIQKNVLLGAKLVAKWLSDANYCDSEGNALPLPRLAKSSDETSFEELVSSTSKDIRPRAILDEWLRLEVVTINEDDIIHLKESAFIPSKSREEKIFFLGRNIHDHFSAARTNINSENPPFLERCVYYDKLSETSIQTLSELAKQEAVNSLLKLNKAANELQKQDTNKKNYKTHRMSFGFYFFNKDHK